MLPTEGVGKHCLKPPAITSQFSTGDRLRRGLSWGQRRAPSRII